MSETIIESRTPRRNEKARNRTRAKLVAAARIVLGRDGIEAAKINDITDEADLAFGSFYNYFLSKEELARTAFVEDAMALANMLDQATPEGADIARVVATNMRKTMDHGMSDPIWGAFLVQSAHTISDLVDQTMGMKLARDLQTGASSGRFFITDIGAMVDCTVGGCIYHLRQMLAGRQSAASVTGLIEYLLRGMGLERDEAAAIAREVS